MATRYIIPPNIIGKKFWSIDEIVEYYHLESNTGYMAMVTQAPESILTTLKMETNKPSIHDLKIIECILKIHDYINRFPFKQILEEYNNRKT